MSITLKQHSEHGNAIQVNKDLASILAEGGASNTLHLKNGIIQSPMIIRLFPTLKTAQACILKLKINPFGTIIEIRPFLSL